MLRFEPIIGLIAAPFTPMGDDGELALDRVETLAEALSANGAGGVLVAGTTGECVSLTVDERMALADRWAAVAPDNFSILVHVGHNCLKSAQALAAHAARIGVRGIASFGPNYYRPTGLDPLIAFCGELASAAPQLPFYYYHIPSMTGVQLSVAELFDRAGEQIPTLAGAKYTHEDLLDFGRCVRLADGRYNMLFGRDEFLLAGLSLGARGAVGTTYTFAAPLYRQLIEAFEGGDMETARARQATSAEIILAFRRYGGLPAAKAIMKMIGLDCGPVRLPMQNISDEQAASLRDDLEAIGFFDYCVRQ